MFCVRILLTPRLFTIWLLEAKITEDNNKMNKLNFKIAIHDRIGTSSCYRSLFNIFKLIIVFLAASGTDLSESVITSLMLNIHSISHCLHFLLLLYHILSFNVFFYICLFIPFASLNSLLDTAVVDKLLFFKYFCKVLCTWVQLYTAVIFLMYNQSLLLEQEMLIHVVSNDILIKL